MSQNACLENICQKIPNVDSLFSKVNLLSLIDLVA